LAPATQISLQQFLFDLPLGARAYPVDGVYEQIHHVVGQGAGAQMDKGGQPSHARGIGLPPQLSWDFNRDAVAATLDIARRRVLE